jgi:protein-tyrosine-phosphatase
MTKVLMVCSGNTCRSPMAAALLTNAARVAGREDIIVESAGTGAVPGSPVSEGMYLVALEQGIDLSAHRARPLTKELVDQSHLILTMGRSHLARVRELGGGMRAQLLGEYAQVTTPGYEIEDPFGGHLEDYRATLKALHGLMPAVIARLIEQSPR